MKKDESQSLQLPTEDFLSEMESLVVFAGDGIGGVYFIAICSGNNTSVCNTNYFATCEGGYSPVDCSPNAVTSCTTIYDCPITTYNGCNTVAGCGG